MLVISSLRKPTMPRMRRWITLAGILGAWVLAPAAQAPASFEVHEATIAGIHAAMKAGRLTCRALVELYVRRIDAYDKNGPAINAIVVTNAQALALADDLDRRFKAGGFT